MADESTSSPSHSGAPWPGRGVAGGAGESGEEARLLLQERLALLGRLGFYVAALFFGLVGLFGLSGLSAEWGPRYLAPSVASAAISAGIWLVCRRGRRPYRTLRALDAGAVFAQCQITALLLWWAITPGVRLYTMALSITYMLIGRTLLVPSSPRLTLMIGLVSCVPFWWVANRLDGSRHAIWVSLWALLGLTLATVGSAVIFGLRREIREARKVGQYTLERRLGEGGMGVVYKAQHAMLRRPTAVKLLPTEKAGEANVRRFEREVQLTAQLSHPNTVSIFDFGRTPDRIFYYAMEYLEGLDLRELVRTDGPQPPARVIHILAQVCGSLREAHEMGLVHRDIKPGNIILCQRGGNPDVVKVVDFGLVKDLGQADEGSHGELLAGTPHYLAPEAITGNSDDPRRDIYAVGTVAYFLLTGQNVFEGSTLVEICSHHLHTRPVAPSERLGRPVPPKVEAWVLACLEKDPDRRPQTARAAAQGLAACDDAGRWGEEEAVRWWAGRSGPPSDPIKEDAGVPLWDATPSMPIDLRNR